MRAHSQNPSTSGSRPTSMALPPATSSSTRPPRAHQAHGWRGGVADRGAPKGVFLFVVRRPPMKYHTSGIGETGEVSPMLLRWIDYDPVALVVLMVGIGAISLLALSM